ncbi:MAG: diphosphomevalonate decarboxylase, partial [Anaerolineales bacterium]|nr:diphosphomevalonate decarboxylase [Anaerolineales bacterium]
LEGLYTRMRVTFTDAVESDSLSINGQITTGPALARVQDILHTVREISGLRLPAQVESVNNFPMGAGIASSASAFAALALAASVAAGLALTEAQLSRLARIGSGSACRSIPGGFVEWQAGQRDEDSYAFTLAPADHWDLVDCIAVVSQAHKKTGSTQGHARAASSPLQAARVADTPRRLDLCRRAILERDFSALVEVIEQDSNLMHAVMMSSNPPILYWQPATIQIMHAVEAWREEGLQVCYTIDAGPNVHVLTLASQYDEVAQRLRQIPAVTQVLVARPGGAARLE